MSKRYNQYFDYQSDDEYYEEELRRERVKRSRNVKRSTYQKNAQRNSDEYEYDDWDNNYDRGAR